MVFVAENSDCLGLVECVVLPHDNVPEFATQHDALIETYEGRLRFVRMTDEEYWVETVE